MEREILIWDAIRQMREFTAKGVCFSMVYMSYDRSRQRSTGIVRVNRAILRAQASVDENINADHMLNYLDKDMNLPRRFYQILLMEFNGYKINPE